MDKIINYIKDVSSKFPVYSTFLYLGITVVATVTAIVLIASMAFSDRDTRVVTGPSTPPTAPPDNHYIIGDDSQPLPSTPGTNSIKLTLTDPDASSLLSLSLADFLPIDDASVSFLSPNLVQVTGKVNKKDLGQLVDEANYSLAKAALVLAPSILDIDLKFTVTLENDTLILTPENILINNLNITKFIPQTAVDKMSEALLSLLPDGLKIKSIDITDGSIEFTLTADI